MSNSKDKTAILLIGPPGSGKSSIAKQLKSISNLIVIGTGNLLREEAEKNTPEGKEINALLEEGKFVPTSIIMEIVYNKVLNSDKEIFLFDGFPRTEDQVNPFFELCERTGLTLKAVIIIDIPEEESIKRLSGRRVCTKCNEIYNIYYNPPPGNKCKCGDELKIRDDDKPEVIQKRLKVYKENTEPIINYFYKNYGGITYAVNGIKSVEEIADEVYSKL